MHLGFKNQVGFVGEFIDRCLDGELWHSRVYKQFLLSRTMSGKFFIISGKASSPVYVYNLRVTFLRTPSSKMYWSDILRVPRFESRTVGWKERILPLSYTASLYIYFAVSHRQLFQQTSNIVILLLLKISPKLFEWSEWEGHYNEITGIQTSYQLVLQNKKNAGTRMRTLDFSKSVFLKLFVTRKKLIRLL